MKLVGDDKVFNCSINGFSNKQCEILYYHMRVRLNMSEGMSIKHCHTSFSFPQHVYQWLFI